MTDDFYLLRQRILQVLEEFSDADSIGTYPNDPRVSTDNSNLEPDDASVPPCIALYESRDFKGSALFLTENALDLRQFYNRCVVGHGPSGHWSDRVSSFIVFTGQWKLYQHIGQQPGAGGTSWGPFGPGRYSDVRKLGIPDNFVSAVRTF